MEFKNFSVWSSEEDMSLQKHKNESPTRISFDNAQYHQVWIIVSA
jgi:hypothetical protein